MHRGKLSQKTISPADRICRFKLDDLVRIDLVFPYGRVAASRDVLKPEPFDRDAEYSVSARDIEEMRACVRSLFRPARGSD